MSYETEANYFQAYTAFASLEEQGESIAHELDWAARSIGASLAGGRVLDLGCGQGQVVRALRQRGCEAFGVELSEWALQHALAEAAPFLSSGDALELSSYRDAEFDFVLGNLTPHIAPERMVDFLRGAARIARSGLFIRYITEAWAERFERDFGAKGTEARALFMPWTREHPWWKQRFADANLQERFRMTDDVWDTWVLLSERD